MGGRERSPENGTAYLQAGLGSTLAFSFMNGSEFGLYSVDLAEYSTVVPDGRARFIGYRTDGSTVTADLNTDGIIDGLGPLADFQTFYFGPEFSAVTRVEIPYPPWSLDNLQVFIPEPGTGALLVVATTLLTLRCFKRKK